MAFYNLISIVFLIIQLPLVLFSSYLLLLTLAAKGGARHTTLIGEEAEIRFACLVPAHNEEQLLPALLESFLLQEYPRHLFTLHVIADNCEDSTAEVGRRYGAVVHERTDPRRLGKGYALNWCLERLKVAGETPQAYLFVDADSIVSPNFLRIMEAHYRRGERLVQSYYAVRNPEATWNTGLRYVALAALHYLRPLGRSALGFSVGLKGNGMLVDAVLAHNFPWSASVTEDIEYHMTLLLNGERVFFAPDAVVWGEIPETFDQSQSQLNRWEAGRLEMARRYVPQLLKAAWVQVKQGKRQGSLVLLDAVMEHLIPPFTLLVGLALVLLTIGLGFFIYGKAAAVEGWVVSAAALTVWLALASLGVQVLYLLVGLRLVDAPGNVCRSFLYAPVFILKKGKQVLRVLSGRGSKDWVKTRRNVAK